MESMAKTGKTEQRARTGKMVETDHLVIQVNLEMSFKSFQLK